MQRSQSSLNKIEVANPHGFFAKELKVTRISKDDVRYKDRWGYFEEPNLGKFFAAIICNDIQYLREWVSDIDRWFLLVSLYIAYREGNTSLVKFFLTHGALPDQELYDYARGCKIEAIKTSLHLHRLAISTVLRVEEFCTKISDTRDNFSHIADQVEILIQTLHQIKDVQDEISFDPKEIMQTLPKAKKQYQKMLATPVEINEKVSKKLQKIMQPLEQFASTLQPNSIDLAVTLNGIQTVRKHFTSFLTLYNQLLTLESPMPFLFFYLAVSKYKIEHVQVDFADFERYGCSKSFEFIVMNRPEGSDLTKPNTWAEHGFVIEDTGGIYPAAHLPDNSVLHCFAWAKVEKLVITTNQPLEINNLFSALPELEKLVCATIKENKLDSKVVKARKLIDSFIGEKPNQNNNHNNGTKLGK